MCIEMSSSFRIIGKLDLFNDGFVVIIMYQITLRTDLWVMTFEYRSDREGINGANAGKNISVKIE